MLERWFGERGWLYRFLDRLWDLLVLNLLFVLTSIPIVTIGASFSALYSVTLKAVKGEESYIVRSYLTAWKENLKKGTLLWLLVAGVAVTLGIDIFVLGKDSEVLGSILVFAGGLFSIMWILTGIYVFPLQAWFENSVPYTILNSFVIAVKYFPSTIQAAGILTAGPILAVLLGIFFPSLFGWFCSLFLFVGFSGTAYVSSFVFRRTFSQLIPENI
ncbi:MAG: DUF624 domain-containing protein [Eubacteriales bacterium]|nr:DUF624 domain-containing protein [Eubacteriales bacterium]